jgi:hypothetical protein
MGQESIAYHRFRTTRILHCCLSAITAFAASKMALILLLQKLTSKCQLAGYFESMV